MAPTQPNESLRPETDYERWLREKDENYKLQDEPVYEPNSQVLDDAGDNGDKSTRSMIHPPPSIHDQTPPAHTQGLRLLGLRKFLGSNFLLSVLLVSVIVRSVRAFRRRARNLPHEKA
ncbi:hypothetical protein BDV06DRAFT_220915 [Aspergillus oleicola]